MRLPTQQQQARGGPQGLNTRRHSEFLDLLAQAIEASGRGRPAALMHLDVARARDIGATCGRDGLNALQDLLLAVVYNQLGPERPVHGARPGELSLLLSRMLPADAVTVAKRLRSALDNGTFSWHGHPFRLGAHIGLVELGPQPEAPADWLNLVRSACDAAGELGGSGIQLVTLSDHAWSDLEREREWHRHLTEVI